VPLLAQSTLPTRRIALPTSKYLTTPMPGVMGSLNGFTPTIAISPDQRFAAFLNDGYGTQKNGAHQSIAILDLRSNQLNDFPDDRLGENAKQSYFIGLAFSRDGQHLYASVGSISDPAGSEPGDTGNGIAVYQFREGKVIPETFFKIAPQPIAKAKKVPSALRKTPEGTAIPYPAGLTVIPGTDGGNDKLLVVNNYSDTAVVLDARSGIGLARIDLSFRNVIPASYPYSVVASRDGRRAWVSLWNLSQVAEVDLQQGTVKRLIGTMGLADDPNTAGSHPCALLLSPDEKLLYVAMANEDVVAVVSTARGKLAGLLTRMQRGEPNQRGAYPTALAQSPDGKRVYVAETGLNAIAVYDTSKFLSNTTEVQGPGELGLIPTDWYPTAVAVAGDDLLVASSKGQGTGPNSGSNSIPFVRRRREHQYIPTLLYGSVARLSLKKIGEMLGGSTQRVLSDNLLTSTPGKIQFAQGSNPIRHVIYVIKENRTYDQVLGDLKLGDGDPSLTLYGAEVTPNEHKLALQFGVIDNFYDSGEVSGDGHDWSTAATTSDYNEKTWQIAYRSRERTYDFQGMVADEFPLEEGIPDVDAPMSGYIWDNLANHGMTYRDYGEFLGTVWCKTEQKTPAKSPKEGTPSPITASCEKSSVKLGETLPPTVGQPHGAASPWPWAIPLFSGVKPTKAALRGHFDPKFPDFAVDYPDQLRADEFLNEFEGFVRAREEKQGEQLPAFTLLYLPDDHTGGTRPGKPRPAASVADNDLALGRVVEAVSRSPYWDDTAIFVLEDDAQDGADHVDAHRSIAFVISKYSPGSADQPHVEHGFYTTVNVIHTMEVVLGLPPMNLNDAYAPVLSGMFTGAGSQPLFSADTRNRDNGFIYQTNPEQAPGAKASAQMDFSHPDAVNPSVLNSILWQDQKGGAPVPAVKHAVISAKGSD
jgi:DNA-binding beta-propeller fold protein YncE